MATKQFNFTKSDGRTMTVEEKAAILHAHFVDGKGIRAIAGEFDRSMDWVDIIIGTFQYEEKEKAYFEEIYRSNPYDPAKTREEHDDQVRKTPEKAKRKSKRVSRKTHRVAASTSRRHTPRQTSGSSDLQKLRRYQKTGTR